jgi:hypothetical protein
MTLTGGPTGEPACAFPPHPGHGELTDFHAGPLDEDDDGYEDGGEFTDETPWARFRTWAGHSPTERLPLPAMPVIWTATEIMHAAGVHAMYPGIVAGACAALAGWRAERRMHDPDDDRPAEHRMPASDAAGLTALTGAWVTAGTALGPLYGAYDWMSLLYLAGGFGVWRWLRRHPVTRGRHARWAADEARWAAEEAAREKVIAAKTRWHRLAHELHLDGSHLVLERETLMGYERLIDVRRTGSRASQLAGRDLAEHIAEIEGLGRGDVDVWAQKKPVGFLWIRVRTVSDDVWSAPVWHPSATGEWDQSNRYAALVPWRDTIRTPKVIGIDPETGKPLQLVLWDSHGGKVIAVYGSKDAGKTTLFDTITERCTACDDAIVLTINMSKSLEDSWWEPLTAATARDRQLRRARAILTFVWETIRERPRKGRTTRVHQPTPEAPAIILKIDEYSVVEKDPVCAGLLELIHSQCRSEAVTIIKAGQRAATTAGRGAKARANNDIAVWGKFSRRSELEHVADDEANLPDMGDYGGGNAGVFGITSLPTTGDFQKGRTFYWGEESAGLLRLVEARSEHRPPFILEPALSGLADLWAAVEAEDDGTPPEDLDDDDFDGEGAVGLILSGRRPARQPEAAPVTPGVGKLAAMVEEARALADDDDDGPELTDEQEATVEAIFAEKRSQFLADYTDVTIDDGDLRKIIALLHQDGGCSAGDVAKAIGRSRTTAHRYLTHMIHANMAVLHEDGRGGFRAPVTGDPSDPGARVLQLPRRSAGDTL